MTLNLGADARTWEYNLQKELDDWDNADRVDDTPGPSWDVLDISIADLSLDEISQCKKSGISVEKYSYGLWLYDGVDGVIAADTNRMTYRIAQKII